MTLIANCPACDEEIDLDDDIEIGEIVTCTHCETELELISLEPLQLVEWDEEEK